LTWVSASRRLLWAKNNYLKYTTQQRQHRRLVMLLNLIAMDTLIQQEGGEELLSQEQKMEWITKYESQSPKNQ